MMLPPDLTPREMRRAKREHAGLRADWAKAPWWHIAGGYWTVSCSCGWTDPERIPTYGVEVGPFISNLSIDLSMKRHLEETCRSKSRRALRAT